MRFRAARPAARAFGAVLGVNQFPRRRRFEIEFRQFGAMTTLDVLVGVAPERLEIGLLCRLLRDADHPPDRAE
jgi:hypothetical protein